MRKILVGVLSVAGLLAVVLALAASPASAAKAVVTINSAATAGVYTISWETNGGCDPGAGTSGASGSVSITVGATNEDAARTAAAAETPPRTVLNPLELTGTAGQEFVTVNDDCTYSFSAVLVEAAAKAVCGLGGLPDATDADGIPDAAVTLTVTADGSTCAPGGKITVTVGDASRHVTKAAVTCTQAQVDDTENTDCTALTDIAEAAEYDNDGVTAGAIQATRTFVVSATPVPNSADQCQPTSAETSKTRAGAIAADLFLTGNTAIVDGARRTVNCAYDIAIALPAGFTGGASDTHQAADISSGEDPGVSVAVATRNVYLIQDVDGDSGGAYASYRFTTAAAPGDDATKRCVAGLPGALTGVTAGGIITSTTVELREGRFNINAAVNNGSAGPVAAFAMDHKAVPCHASATVKNLPDHCSASNPTNAVSADLVNDADGDGNVLVEHVITCVEPAAEEPAADDMGGDDMGGDDMGADDMGSDDMGGDDMGDDMGPPADVATG